MANALTLKHDKNDGYDLLSETSDGKRLHFQTFSPEGARQWGSIFSEAEVRQVRDYMSWWLGKRADEAKGT